MSMTNPLLCPVAKKKINIPQRDEMKVLIATMTLCLVPPRNTTVRLERCSSGTLTESALHVKSMMIMIKHAKNCRTGHFKAEEGKGSCLQCSPNYFAAPGSTKCTEWPEGIAI